MVRENEYYFGKSRHIADWIGGLKVQDKELQNELELIREDYSL
jgi:hypothetical protein